MKSSNMFSKFIDHFFGWDEERLIYNNRISSQSSEIDILLGEINKLLLLVPKKLPSDIWLKSVPATLFEKQIIHELILQHNEFQDKLKSATMCIATDKENCSVVQDYYDELDEKERMGRIRSGHSKRGSSISRSKRERNSTLEKGKSRRKSRQAKHSPKKIEHKSK